MKLKRLQALTSKRSPPMAPMPYAKVYGAFERHGIDALILPKAEPIKSRVEPSTT
jgi:hypothetical protein